MLGVPSEVDMVGTPVSVKSVAELLLVVVFVEQLLPFPLQEGKVGAETVQPLVPETVQLLLAVCEVVAVEV